MINNGNLGQRRDKIMVNERFQGKGNFLPMEATKKEKEFWAMKGMKEKNQNTSLLLIREENVSSSIGYESVWDYLKCKRVDQKETNNEK